MGFNANDNEYDYEFSCPECGSGRVVVKQESGFYYIDSCKKCGYNRNKELQWNLR